MRIIPRFGRIDRIGAPNARIQLVNFWPNLELEEYLGLEQRLSGRMVLLDISATGEENVIEQQSGDPMNDLEYRRRQLLKLQDAVIDLEDLSSGISIADLTLTDFRIDLADYLRERPDALANLPPGVYAVTTEADAETPPGIIFCLRAEGPAAARSFEPGYPLAPHYLVHVGDNGAVLLPFTQARRILDRLKRLCLGRDLPDAGACARFHRMTRGDREAAFSIQSAQRRASQRPWRRLRAARSASDPKRPSSASSGGRTRRTVVTPDSLSAISANAWRDSVSEARSIRRPGRSQGWMRSTTRSVPALATILIALDIATPFRARRGVSLRTPTAAASPRYRRWPRLRPVAPRRRCSQWRPPTAPRA